jgi:hypothetical protein
VTAKFRGVHNEYVDGKPGAARLNSTSRIPQSRQGELCCGTRSGAKLLQTKRTCGG